MMLSDNSIVGMVPILFNILLISSVYGTMLSQSEGSIIWMQGQPLTFGSDIGGAVCLELPNYRESEPSLYIRYSSVQW